MECMSAAIKELRLNQHTSTTVVYKMLLHLVANWIVAIAEKISESISKIWWR